MEHKSFSAREDRKYSESRFTLKSQPNIDIDSICEDIQFDENFDPNQHRVYSKFTESDDNDLVVIAKIVCYFFNRLLHSSFQITAPSQISTLNLNEPQAEEVPSLVDIPTYDSNPWSLTRPTNLRSFSRSSSDRYFSNQTIPRNSTNMRYKMELGAPRDAFPPYIPRGTLSYFEVGSYNIHTCIK